VRVLHVTPYFAPAFRYGGPPRSILGLCRALAGTGVDVEVFTTTANGDEPLPAAPKGVDYEGVRVRYFPLAWPRRYWRASGLGAALREAARTADLVHIHGLWNMTGWAGSAAARSAHRPYVISPRGMLQPAARLRHREMKALAYWGVERANLRGAALLHATSAMEARELTAYGPPVVTIPNGVAPPAVAAGAVARLRTLLRLGPDDEIVTFLGRLHPIKRLDLIAEAFAIVRHARPNARLVIAGPDEGGHRQQVEPLFADVADATRWLGAIDAETTAALLAASRVLAQCSDSESFGMSVAEALVAGVPVVVTRRSGWAEVEAVGCGLSVAHEPVAIADGILRILEPDADGAAMGARGRDWARQRFAWDAVGRAMREAYAGAIAPPAPRSPR
jgi:glycosyltransferase involved in cell wall biosynthesis